MTAFNVLVGSASKNMGSAYTCICTHSLCTHVYTHICAHCSAPYTCICTHSHCTHVYTHILLCPIDMDTRTYMYTLVFESQEESQRGELRVGSWALGLAFLHSGSLVYSLTESSPERREDQGLMWMAPGGCGSRHRHRNTQDRARGELQVIGLGKKGCARLRWQRQARSTVMEAGVRGGRNQGHTIQGWAALAFIYCK